MGNSYRGKPPRNYRGQQEIICSREYGVTIGGINNNRFTVVRPKKVAFSEEKKISRNENSGDFNSQVRHFDACFNLEEATIFEISFLMCDRMTD